MALGMIFLSNEGKVYVPNLVKLVKGDEERSVSYWDVSRHKLMGPSIRIRRTPYYLNLRSDPWPAQSGNHYALGRLTKRADISG
jgi:hypothetical protein